MLGHPGRVLQAGRYCIAQSRGPQDELSLVWCIYGLCCWVQKHEVGGWQSDDGLGRYSLARSLVLHGACCIECVEW